MSGLTQIIKVLTRDSGILDWCLTNSSKPVKRQLVNAIQDPAEFIILVDGSPRSLRMKYF